jgi:hypothetical protein
MCEPLRWNLLRLLIPSGSGSVALILLYEVSESQRFISQMANIARSG